MDSVETFVRRFKKEGWKMEPPPFDTVLRLIEERSPELGDLAVALVLEIDEPPSFLDAIVSQLDDAQLRAVAVAAMEIAEPEPSDIVMAVLGMIALQAPTVLQFDLPRIAAFRHEGDDSLSRAWRSADAEEISRLQNRLQGAEARTALRLLFETDRREVIVASLAVPPAIEPDMIQRIGEDVALRIQDDRIDPLIVGPCHHLLFDLGEAQGRGEPGSVAHMKSLHPSFNLSSDRDFRRTFGGALDERCGLCGGELHQLIDLSALPEAFRVSPARLTIGTCLSCLGWERPELFYDHREDGSPRCRNGDGTLIEPQMLAEPLAETIVRASPTPYRWQSQSIMDSQNVNRLGGRPEWVQYPDFPSCIGCEETMPFLAQLDSFLTTESGDEWLWGSGGSCYIFWCDGCRISALKWQCT